MTPIALYVDGHVELDATLPAIETAVRDLDGAHHTLVVVELPSRATITVGGGPDRFVAEVTDPARRHWTVEQPARPAGTVTIVIGAERVATPARLCIDQAAALEAVRTFVLQNGARSDRLQWSAERPA